MSNRNAVLNAPNASGRASSRGKGQRRQNACEHCGEAFRKKRKWARFCCDQCRRDSWWVKKLQHTDTPLNGDGVPQHYEG
jgi:protein-arginine kinase activator protein McsA